MFKCNGVLLFLNGRCVSGFYKMMLLLYFRLVDVIIFVLVFLKRELDHDRQLTSYTRHHRHTAWEMWIWPKRHISVFLIIFFHTRENTSVMCLTTTVLKSTLVKVIFISVLVQSLLSNTREKTKTRLDKQSKSQISCVYLGWKISRMKKTHPCGHDCDYK